MREYELIYVVQPDATTERLQEIHERIDATITGGQGMVLLRDDWGKRKLAYEVAKFQKGHYFLLAFLGDGKFIQETERLLRIDPDVLRFLTVQVEEQVVDIDARVASANEQAAEQAKRREERERIEAERERERAEAAAQMRETVAAEEAARAASKAESDDEAKDADAGKGADAGKSDDAADAKGAADGE